MNTFILKSVILEDGIPVFFTFKSCVQHRLIKILMYTRRIKFSWGKTFPLCTFAIIPFGGPMLQSLTGSIHCHVLLKYDAIYGSTFLPGCQMVHQRTLLLH